MAVADQLYRFDHFMLDTGRRALLADGVPVPLSSRAFDILRMLVACRDRVVTKDEILDEVWHGTIVEENNLAVQISGLRRALGERSGGPQLIVTIPGRGYRFVGQVTEVESATSMVPAAEILPPIGEGSIASAAPLPVAVAEGPRRRFPYGRIAGIVAILLAGFGAAWLILTEPWGRTPPRLSIVVMPFRNLSDDPEQNYLADAVSDDVTTDLAHIPGSFVIARTSADAYKGKAVPAGQVGRELGVRYLLEGSVRRADDKILINAQLIDTETEAHLWADRFDTLQTKLSDAQSAIVGRIASALNFTLVQIEGQRSLRDRPNDPDALDLFFRARSILDRDDSPGGLSKAQSLLEKAITAQPDFAEAMSELAWLLLSKAMEYDDPTTSQDVAEARGLATRALARNPQDTKALSVRGVLSMIDGHYQEAEADFRLALSLDENSIPARIGLLRCRSDLGHPEEAIRLIQEILRIDPSNPRNRDRYRELGFAELKLGRTDEAIDWLHRAAAGPEPREDTEMELIAAEYLAGRTAEAQSRYQRYDRLWPHRTAWRQSCYQSQTASVLPGLKRVYAALVGAGMPEFANESSDDGVKPSPQPLRAGDFEPTPMVVPGAQTIVTSNLEKVHHDNPSASVIDVGCGGAVIPGALWMRWVEGDSLLSSDGRTRFQREVEQRTHGDQSEIIIVMGSGTYGWGSYNAAITLVSLGYRNVLWYRGGEEAWAAAGLSSEDHRIP